MNRHFISRTLWMAWVVLLLAPILAFAQSPYAGTYMGTYHGPGDDGEFALIIDNHGRGRVAAFDSVDNGGYLEDNIQVDPDGAFEFVTREGVQINGQATASGVTGQYSRDSQQGSFSGIRMSDDGPLMDVAGYYSGAVTMTESESETLLHSHLVAIVAPDGTAFFLLKRGYRDGADVFPDGFDLDLDLGSDLGIDFDFDPSFPFGPGPDSSFPFGPDTGFNWPFGPAFGSPFDFAPWPGFDSSFSWGDWFSTSVDIGPFLDFDARYHFGTGNCGLGWPFNVGLTFSISVSLLGSVEFEFGTGQSDCGAFGSWYGFPLPVGVSGGIAQIDPDGVVQATLPGGLVLQGALDLVSGVAEGILSYQDHDTTWSGIWSVDRYGAGGGNRVATMYGPLSDIDKDGFADVLWHDPVSGESVAWLMEGTDTLAELPLEFPGSADESAHWDLVAVREVDGDGEPDVIWRHGDSGDIIAELSGGAGAVDLELAPAWQVIGSGEFVRDSRPGLLLRHRGSGAVAAITDLAGQPEQVSLPAMGDQAWSVVALADFDGNGYTDILWARQSSHDLRIWLMDGPTISEEVYFSAERRRKFQLAGVGDFNGDGAADLLWRKTRNGKLALTVGPALAKTKNVRLATSTAREWQVVAVGDLDGDGTDDLVWRHLLSGENAAWMIVDAKVAETHPLEPMTGLFWEIRN